MNRGHTLTLYPQKLKNLKPLELIWVEAGTFKMGSAEIATPISSESYALPQFTVRISQGFWLSKYQITQAQWELVMKTHPSQNCADCPVTHINWHQAISFCDRLNQEFAEKIPLGYSFSLPTEAQWEYACRAGTQTRYHSGSTLEDLSRVAWHAGNSSGIVHPVGEKEPNNWGFYDMHGNVYEWCYDPCSFAPTLESYMIDWIDEGDGIDRAIRGGGGAKSPPDAKVFFCDSRLSMEADNLSEYFGFRLCLRPVIGNR